MRKIWDIHGGVHPPENKLQSLQNTIESAPVPPILVLPLSQHIGAPAVPCVEVGDKVLKGQCIAEAAGPVSVPVHASSSGTVVAIEERTVPHASGLLDQCIVIETDGEDHWRETKPRSHWQDLEPVKLIDIVRNAGIAGMGGAGFPSAIKLNVPPQKNIDTLILNGTECEPYITADHALLRERASKLADGIAVLAKIIQPEKIIVGIEDNKLDVIEGVKAALDNWDYSAVTAKDCGIEVVTFPTKYPSGGEKQLIEILTGKQVPSGGLPADLGIVCQNLGTTIAVRDAVIEDKPLLSRITTFTGESIAQKGNVEVLLGTPISFMLEQRSYQVERSSRVIMGGPMMGFSLQDLDAPIVKTTNCILAPTEKELPTPAPAQACIRCGMCAEACPASLLPQQLFWFSQGKELDKLVDHNIADCIECGACSYVCPSHIPLVQYYRASKAEIRQREIDLKQAEASKVRFEARQERLERLEQEKIAARKARQAKAAANKAKAASAKAAGLADAATDDKAAAIAAAVERAKAKKAANAAQAADVDLDDPVAKALAARAAKEYGAPVDEHARLKQGVETAEQRLAKAQQRYKDAEASEDKNLAAFKTGLEKSEEKLEKAKQALVAYEAENKVEAEPVAEPKTTQTVEEEKSVDPNDPIAKALAKRAAMASAAPLDEEGKLKQAVEKATERLSKAQQRLVDAEAKSDPNLAAFKNAVEKTAQKLQEAKQALDAFKS